MGIKINIITCNGVLTHDEEYNKNISEVIIIKLHDAVKRMGIKAIEDIKIYTNEDSNTILRIRVACKKAIELVKEYT